MCNDIVKWTLRSHYQGTSIGNTLLDQADDLYSLTTSGACASCHSGGNLHPQRSYRPAVCSVPG